MTAGDAAERQLYDRLVETLGEEPAMTLLDRLPPPGEELATRTDIDRLEHRMDRLEDRMDRLEDRMDGFNVRLDGLHLAIRESTNELHNSIEQQGRNFTLALVGSYASLAAAAVGVAALI